MGGFIETRSKKKMNLGHKLFALLILYNNNLSGNNDSCMQTFFSTRADDCKQMKTPERTCCAVIEHHAVPRDQFETFISKAKNTTLRATQLAWD